MKNKLFFILTIMVTSLNAQNFIGDWKGHLSVQGMQMEIIFHITEKDNQFLTTLDVPIQGAVGIPLDKTEVNGVEISIAATKMGITFKGQLKDKTIEGVFKQAGMDLPLTLTKFESKLPGNIKLPSSNQELLT